MGKLHRLLAQKTVLPVYDIVRGTHRDQYQKILEKTQWLSTKEILANQVKSLHMLIRHSYDTVPYYHALLKKNGLRPDDIRSLEDLRKIPLLGKTDIQDHKANLTSTAIPIRELYNYYSGGTNYPIHFLLTREHNSWQLAAEYRSYEWMGYEFGDRCMRLEGSMNIPRKPGTLKKVTNWLERSSLLSFHNVSDESVRSYIDIIKKFNPEIIRSNASCVYFIGQYMLRMGLDCIRPRLIITSAKCLLPEQRRLVEKAFSCPVYDYYGCREFGSLASECEERNGFHITAENVIIEFIKEGEHVSPGEMGEIVITNLRNYECLS